jgi:hypothetical protein
MAAKEIVWTTTDQGNLVGRVGKVKVFSVSWGVVRDKEKPWILRTTLPGYKDSGLPVASREEGQRIAQRTLENFLERMSDA